MILLQKCRSIKFPSTFGGSTNYFFKERYFVMGVSDVHSSSVSTRINFQTCNGIFFQNNWLLRFQVPCFFTHLSARFLVKNRAKIRITSRLRIEIQHRHVILNDGIFPGATVHKWWRSFRPRHVIESQEKVVENEFF